jgi:outer membrane protein
MERVVSFVMESRKIHLKLALLILAGGVLTGACTSSTITVAKNEAPLPQEAVLKQWRARAQAPSDPYQGPLTVERAVEEALKASPELEQIRQRMRAAAEQVRQADATFYPRLIVSEDYNLTNNSVFALMDIINQRRFRPDIDFNNPGAQQNFGSRIRGDWMLFEGGSRWYERRATVAQQRSVSAELEAARNQMAARVTEIYYQWLQALAFIGVAERALESAQTDERLGEARIRAETALPSELSRLKARRAEAHGNLVTAQSNALKLQAGLERLMVRRIQSCEIPDPGVDMAAAAIEAHPRDTDPYVEAALERRPEMSAVRSLIQAARERVRSAQGGLMPRLGSNVDYMLDSENLSKFSDSWFVGIQMTWPLFEGGLSVARIQEARTRLKEVEARGEQVALDIALEVNQATVAVNEAAEKIRVAEERKRWAEKALREIRLIYSKQAATLDSLLQAEVAWNQAEVSYTAALYEGKIAQAILRRALGDFAHEISVISVQ